MATETIRVETPPEDHTGQTLANPVAETKQMFHDLAAEVKEETDVMRSGQQPVKPQADLLIRKHLIGIIILLFGLVALILLIAMGGIGLSGHGH